MTGILDRVKSYGMGDLLKSGVDTYILYSLIKRIAKPFKDWKAYKLGVIDERGNILIPKDKRNDEQYKSLTYLDIFVMNFKKLLQKVPSLNNKYVTYAAALYLLREDRYINYDLLNEDGISTSSEGIARSSSGEANTFKSSFKSSFESSSKIYKKKERRPEDFERNQRLKILKRNAV